MRPRLLPLIAFVLFALTGCTKTWVGGHFYFPPKTDATSAKYHLVIDVEGAYRTAYVDQTEKEVRLTILEGKKSVFSRKYTVSATDLDWDVQWDKQDDLQITFFDFPEGKSGYGNYAFTLPSKQIFAVRFTYDTSAGSFTEFPLSKETLNHARQWLKKGN
jgi:hypothetical protein